MTKTIRLPDCTQQNVLDQVHVRPALPQETDRIQSLLQQHHYLGGIHPVGERLYYIARDGSDQWLAVLLFSAAAKHLKDRDRWIGWTEEQRRRRLSLVTNNSRFLLLPERTVPNLGSRVLALTLDRVARDWRDQYGHPVEVVETFVDPEQFCGTVYTANGWMELGQTDGWGRSQRDYYVKHNKPKRLFVRELRPQSCRALQAEHLKPDLAVVEAAAPPRCTLRVKEIGSIVEHFRKLPEYRKRVESYPLYSLASLMLLAMLCEAPRGQTDLAKFAGMLNQGQRRVLGVRRNPQGKYPAPSQSTFSRFLAGVDAAKLQQTLLAIQQLVRGPAPQNELVVMDGKEPRHGSGASVLSAVTVPSQHFLGSALVDQKTNEIPVAQNQLIPSLDLAGRLVSLDALHTQNETARGQVLEAGGDYLLTVKNNQPTLKAGIEKKVPAAASHFPPGAAHRDAGAPL
jgi:Domain of unknown function (DUF4338)/DDE_Tnp_1-associated